MSFVIQSHLDENISTTSFGLLSVYSDRIESVSISKTEKNESVLIQVGRVLISEDDIKR